MLKRAVVFSICGLFLAGYANAAVKTVKLGDDAIYWLDDSDESYGDTTVWQEDSDGNGTYQPSDGTYSADWKNDHDVIGGPDFSNDPYELGLSRLTYDDYTGSQGTLLSLTFVYEHTPDELTMPGDLFLDEGDDGDWDYVVRTPHAGGGDVRNAVQASGQSWEAYSGSWDYLQDTGLYEVGHESKRADDVSWGSNYVIRTDHPWRVDDDAMSDATYFGDDKKVGFDGWKYSSGASESTFDVEDLDIKLFDEQGDPLDWRIGFTVNCANDVVFQEVPPNSLSLTVPEPMSLAIWSLLGLGFVGGLTAVRRRKGAAMGGARWSSENRRAIRGIIERGRRSE